MADDKRAKGYSVNVMVQKKIVGTLTFLSKGVFVKMCKAGDGLLERILIAALKSDLLPPTVHVHVIKYNNSSSNLNRHSGQSYCMFLIISNTYIKPESPGYTNFLRKQRPYTTTTVVE